MRARWCWRWVMVNRSDEVYQDRVSSGVGARAFAGLFVRCWRCAPVGCQESGATRNMLRTICKVLQYYSYSADLRQVEDL